MPHGARLADRSAHPARSARERQRESPWHRRRRWVVLAGPLALAGIAGCATSTTPPATSGSDRAGATIGTTAGTTAGTTLGRTAGRPDVAGPVDLGNGRSIYLECRGSGSPTVVLVGGLGERADNWMTTNDDPPQPDHSVFAGVEKDTRVCAYDRPGTATAKSDGTGFELSRSTPVATPATVRDSAIDLDALLRAAGETGPYVLVGHSLGGPIVRLYAGAHPTDVAAVVLDDGLSEDLGARLTPSQLEAFEKLNDPVEQGRPAGSEAVFYSAALVSQLKAAAPVPNVPVVVLSADRWPFTAEVIDAGHAAGQLPAYVTVQFSDALWAAQLAAQDELATKFPGAKHVTKTGSGHYIHLDNPRLVIDSILEVVAQVRSAGPR